MKLWQAGCVVLLSMASSALARDSGGTSSGGGKILQDAENPWWLENTRVVRYCLDTADGFGASPEAARTAFLGALTYWKTILRDADTNYYSPGELAPFTQVRVGTQDFVEEPCGDNTDLHLQFGTLNDAQKQALPNPTDFIAAAFRSSYNPKTLHGQGFLYVAPDSGPLRPSARTMAEHPWSAANGLVLELVIAHELGHIFGVQHDSRYLMEERTPAFLVEQGMVDGLNNDPALARDFADNWLGKNSIFRYRLDKGIEECSARRDSLPSTRTEFFGYPPGMQCIRLRFEAQDPLTLVVEVTPERGQLYHRVGAFRGERERDSHPFVRVFFTPEQLVFTKLPAHLMASDFLTAVEKDEEFMLNGNYIADTGASRVGFVTLLPNGRYRVGGLMDDRLNMDILSNW